MANHIDYDREENKIELILDSQGNVISTLAYFPKMVITLNSGVLFDCPFLLSA